MGSAFGCCEHLGGVECRNDPFYFVSIVVYCYWIVSLDSLLGVICYALEGCKL